MNGLFIIYLPQFSDSSLLINVTRRPGRHVAVLFVPSLDYGCPASPACRHFLVKEYCITLVELVTHVDLVKYCITHGHMYWQIDLVALI